MDSLKEKIDSKKLPSHIAVIMDGNGRWAGKKDRIAYMVIIMELKAFAKSSKAARNWASDGLLYMLFQLKIGTGHRMK